MEITEVRIKLMASSEDRLRGFCSVTFDSCFVVRDLKIIDGNSGPFVAMPSRKLTSNCSRCHTKNHLRANYCNNCGQKLKQIKPQQGSDGRAKLYADIAHPINAKCREMIQNRVIEELRKEQQLSREPGYRSKYDEAYDAGPVVDPDEISKEPPKKDPAPRESAADAKESTATDAKDSAPKTTEVRNDKEHDRSPPHQRPAKDSENAGKEGSSSRKNDVSDDFGKGVFE